MSAELGSAARLQRKNPDSVPLLGNGVTSDQVAPSSSERKTRLFGEPPAFVEAISRVAVVPECTMSQPSPPRPGLHVEPKPTSFNPLSWNAAALPLALASGLTSRL